MNMEQILYLIGIIVAVEGGFKAIEYFIDKITANYAKKKQIDENSEGLADYKVKTDKRLEELDGKVEDSKRYAIDSLNNLEKAITSVLDKHKEEYMTEIKNVNSRLDDVDDSITNMKAVYQQTVAVVDIKIEALEKAQNKHNNLIERTYKLEQASALHEEQIKYGNSRIEDLEKKVM